MTTQWVILNVGGEVFRTTLDTLTKEKDSLLGALFTSENWPSAKDENGEIVFDADPKYFRVILNFLRHGQLVLDDGLNLNGVFCTARYFQMQRLVTIIQEKIKTQTTAVNGSPVAASTTKKRKQPEKKTENPEVTPSPKGTKKSPAAPKKRKINRDPNAPKKPLTAFMLFNIAQRPTIRKETPSANFIELGKIVGEKWKGLGPDDKKIYEERARDDKERYAKELTNYKLLPKDIPNSESSESSEPSKSVSSESSESEGDDHANPIQKLDQLISQSKLSIK